MGFILAFSKNPNKILDNIQSPADVDHLIAKRMEYGKSQKAKGLVKKTHVNITSNPSSQNYESINAELDCHKNQ